MTALAIEEPRSRGAYTTPRDIALCLAQWAIRSPGDRVLDPAVGEGVFLDATVQILRQLGAREPLRGFAGIEIHRRSLGHTAETLASLRTTPLLRRADFFSTEPPDFGHRFEAVIGNPPYVRNGWFSSALRNRALERAAAMGVPLPLSTDLWAPFVIYSTKFITPLGRLAFVLPSTLLQAAYAAPVRSFLLDRFSSVTVVTLNRALFATAEVEAVLLLADQAGPRGLNLAHWSGFGALGAVSMRSIDRPHRMWAIHKHPQGAETLQELLADGRFVQLDTAMVARIGTVTGANDFFVLRKSELQRRKLPPRLFRRVLVSPTRIRGAVVRQRDLEVLDSGDYPANLLCLRGDARGRKHARVAAYLRRGRRLGVHLGYKTAARRRWYEVVVDAPPDIFMSYMSHDFVRVSLNSAGAGSTNLVHQLRVRNATDARALVAALHSSVAQLSAEVRGRTYGGGVLKLEPSDVQHLLVPCNDRAVQADLRRALPLVDRLLRQGKPDEARRVVDDVLVRLGVVADHELAVVRSQLDCIRSVRKSRGAVHKAMARSANPKPSGSSRR